jgi:hypothetical protein
MGIERREFFTWWISPHRYNKIEIEKMSESVKGPAGKSGKKPMGERLKFTRPIASAGGRGPVLTLIHVSKHAKQQVKK